ncbi:AMP-binding protein [Sphingobium rhizovicinum]|jgi:acyl-CoA synthetase (AMP-forming)/AMP-acid ligase II|uniref:AMP-binding protein n=1 Tax=Sphingobium rhizovicinum TaxID=432308 RepID=A0ABV7NEV0_9SPHN
MTQLRLLETVAAEAYDYPLLIRRLLPQAETTNEEIVSDGRRFRYAEFVERVHRLASGLSQLGVQAGDTVAVMDWDSHRYLECYFAIPMLGAILQTVNVRLAPAAIGLLAAARFRCAVGRRTPSYRRHCRDRCRRRGSDRRSVEGRHQDGRRMGLVA